MNINLPVDWQEGRDPSCEGLYFLAVRYPTGFGSYDFTKWNGREWELGYEAEVVGWAAMDSVLNVVKAGWPKGDEEFSKDFDKFYRKNKGSGSDGDDFVEV